MTWACAMQNSNRNCQRCRSLYLTHPCSTSIVESRPRPHLRTMPDPATVPELPLFQTGGTSRPDSNWLPETTTAPSLGTSGADGGSGQGLPPQNAPCSVYDPMVALPPRLVKRILNLEFLEMSELLLDAWPDEASSADPGHPHRRTRRPPVTDILSWLEAFGRLASVLCSKYPEKAAEFWAYQSSILRAVKNFEGPARVAYDRQYRREALARRDLNWSACNPRLYNEAFTGRAKTIPRCQHCLSNTHGSQAYPANPDPAAPWQPSLRPPTADSQDERQEICRNYNDGKCKYQRCKYAHICKECFYPHPWTACHRNQQTTQRRRSRSPKWPHYRPTTYPA